MFKGKTMRIADFLYKDCIRIPQKEANTQLYVLARLSRLLNDKNFLKNYQHVRPDNKLLMFLQNTKKTISVD
jgi:mannitol/fructose-specific phosphotransferase system IIA component (Ntr-type)